MKRSYHLTVVTTLRSTHHKTRHHQRRSWEKWTLIVKNKGKEKGSSRRSWVRSQENSESYKNKGLTWGSWAMMDRLTMSSMSQWTRVTTVSQMEAGGKRVIKRLSAKRSRRSPNWPMSSFWANSKSWVDKTKPMKTTNRDTTMTAGWMSCKS